MKYGFFVRRLQDGQEQQALRGSAELKGLRVTVLRLAFVFLLVNLLINSRVGRMTEEVLVDWTLQAWHRVGVRFLVGLFTWIVDLFRGILRWVERFMYAVDEWLRFRTGEGRLTIAPRRSPPVPARKVMFIRSGSPGLG